MRPGTRARPLVLQPATQTIYPDLPPRKKVSPSLVHPSSGSGAGFGVWAFFAPASFAEFVAFPYNRHLLHDVGAFQIGIGATVLLALVWADSIMVVLGGYVVGGSFHIVDRHIGGPPPTTRWC
jgi:hypothetical protein